VISPVINNNQYYYYDKPVIILMDSSNFSACDIFLGAFKGWRNVTLLGTPSGGGSGSAISYRLYHSYISLKLSSMASFRSNGTLYDGNGIQPDVYCEPTPTDYIGQTDTVLDKAREIISEKSN
jgi:C-terminal processing protease CtpA/Prc